MATQPKHLEKIVLEERLRFAEEVVLRAGVLDEETQEVLIKAFAAVPREQFLDPRFAAHAYQDIVLPIGYGQTIEKPSMLARMAALLGVRKGQRILEIGSGSGYSSAVLSATGARIFTVEGVGLLAQRTRHKLDNLKYGNVIIRRGSGTKGWSEYAPYDAILVSTPIASIDQELLDQLVRPGGRLVAPIGDAKAQNLTLWEAKASGISKYQLEACDFNQTSSAADH